MISTLKGLFNRLIDAGGKDAADGEALRIATAALLVEMSRSDKQITAEELASIEKTLREQFELDSGALDDLLKLAETEVSQAVGYYPFTSLINRQCGLEQKIRIVEAMWRVAMSDGHISAHENHLMRKIADLLYVGHADYIAAKQRARASAGLPPA
ncbi:MAG: TerB family tellurite resistance protein [Propionivibrio sp.]